MKSTFLFYLCWLAAEILLSWKKESHLGIKIRSVLACTQYDVRNRWASKWLNKNVTPSGQTLSERWNMGPIPAVLMPPGWSAGLFHSKSGQNSSLWLLLSGQVFVANVRGWHLTFSKRTEELWYLREKKRLSYVPGFSQFRLFLSLRDINNESSVDKPHQLLTSLVCHLGCPGRCAVWELRNWPWWTIPFFLGPIFLWICRGFSPRAFLRIEKMDPHAFSLSPLKGPYCFEKMYGSYNLNSHSITLSSIMLKT